MTLVRSWHVLMKFGDDTKLNREGECNIVQEKLNDLESKVLEMG